MARRKPDSHLSFMPGEHVHPIQAFKALADADSWVRADATVVDDSTFRVVYQDGSEKRFHCARAHTARASIEAHATREGYPVLVSARWGVLALPVGEGGGPPPRRASFNTRFAELRDGGAVSTPLGDGGQLLLFSITETDAA